jgi:hypothetical protein
MNVHAYKQTDIKLSMQSDNYTIQIIQSHIAAIREVHDTDARIRMLHKLNNMLPKHKRLKLPTLITNAYIRRALDIIQERAMGNTVCA